MQSGKSYLWWAIYIHVVIDYYSAMYIFRTLLVLSEYSELHLHYNVDYISELR